MLEYTLRYAVRVLVATLLVGGLATLGCGDDTTVGAGGGGPAGGEGGVGGAAGGGAGAPSYVGAVGEVTFVGPWGGAATALQEDPSQAGRIFAVAGGQVFGSEDDGATWQQAAPVELDALSLLVLSDGRLLVGTMTDILVSSDHGASWQSIKHDVEVGYGFGIQVKGIAYEVGPPARIWIALGSYQTAPIWVLEDGKTSWQPWKAPVGWDSDPLNGAAQLSSIDVAVDPGNGKTVVFATYEESFGAGGGVFCSTDPAAGFALCSTGLPEVPYHRVRVYSGLVVVAGGQIFGSAFAGIYYSTDLGSSWKQSGGGWTNPIANDFIRLDAGDFLVSTYGNGLLRSADLSASWAPAVAFAGMEVNALAELGSGDLLAGPEQLGVYRSTDGGTSWAVSAEGIDRVAISDAALDPTAPDSFLAAMSSLNSGLAIHTETGIDGWGPVESLPHPRFSLVSISASGRWYVVSDGPIGQAQDGIYVSADAGKSFEFIGPLDGPMMDHDIVGIVERDDGERLIAAGQYWADGDWSPFVTESLDGGKSWTERFRGQANHAPTRLAATAAGELFLSVQGESIVQFDADWQASTITIPDVVDGAVADVAACDGDPTALLAVGLIDSKSYAQGAFSSHDGGASWTKLGLGTVGDDQPRFVGFHPYDCDLVFLATWQGRLLSSSDAGQKWSDLDLGVELAPQIMKVIPLGDDLEASLLVAGTGGIASVRLTTSVLGD